MLQNIRERAQGIIAWIIFVLLALAFGFWGIQSVFHLGGGSTKKAIAKVNGTTITENQLRVAYQRLTAQQKQNLGNKFVLNQQTESKLKQKALQQLILNALLANNAKTQGYRITQGQIDSVLMSIPAFQVDGKFSPERFRLVLNSMMFTEAGFIRQLRADMLMNQVHLGIVTSAFALPDEVARAYQLINQRRDIDYVLIPTQQFKNEVKLSEQDLQNYYQQHKQAFKTPEQVKVAYLELSYKDILQKQKFSEAQLKQYYQSNIDNYKAPAKWQVAHILIALPKSATKSQTAKAKQQIDTIYQALRQGKVFAELAKDKSQDVVSSEKGGKLPWFSAGNVDPAYITTVTKLKPGQYSQPVRTQYGYEIIKLLAEKPAKVLPFAEVKARVKNMLAAQHAQKVFADENDQLSDITYSNPDTLKTAADKLGLTIKYTDYFTRKGDKKGLLANPKVVATAFSDDVSANKNNSDVIQLNQQKVIVLRVANHKAAAVKSFSMVKDEIKTKLIEQKASKLAGALATTLVNELQQGKTLQQLASTHNLTLKVANNIDRHNEKLNAEILTKAFKLPLPSENKAKPAASLALEDGGYAVIQLMKVIPGNPDTMTKQQLQAYLQQVASGYGQLDYQLYVKQQRHKAKIKIVDQNYA